MITVQQVYGIGPLEALRKFYEPALLVPPYCLLRLGAHIGLSLSDWVSVLSLVTLFFCVHVVGLPGSAMSL